MPRIQFSPNPAQEEFLLAMRPGKRHLFLCGWGTGKTTCGAFVAQRLAHLNPHVRGLVISHNYNHCKHNLVPKIIDFLKQAGTFVKHHATDRIITLRTENGYAEIQWGSADKPKSTDGSDTGWNVGDELRHWPAETYPIYSSRMRDKSAKFPAEVNLTTPDSNWVRAEFENAEGLICVVASSYANAANLQPDYLPNLEKRLSPALFKQFVLAQWIGAEGAAFPEFDRAIHVEEGLADFGRSSDGLAAVHPCLDFGGKHAATFLQHFDWCPRHQTANCFHFIGEWMPDGIPTVVFTSRLAREMRDRGFKALTCFPDKAGAALNYQSMVRDIDLLRQNGFECTWTTDPTVISIINGVDHMRAMLKPEKGRPRLYFDSSLLGSERGIVTAMESIKTRPGSREYQKDKMFEHALDASRYGIVNIEPPVLLTWTAH